MKPPHILPLFISDRLVLQELSYQMVIHIVGGALYQAKKDIWTTLLLYIGNYFFSNTKQVQEEVNTLLFYHFGEEIFRRHDPKGVVKYYFYKIGLQLEYTIDIWGE
jgi:hypothetical protein